MKVRMERFAKGWLGSRKAQSLVAALGLAALATLGADSAVAQDSQNKYIDPSSALPSTTGSPWTFSARSNFVSSYYYRGLRLYDGLSIQPSVGAFYSLGDYGTLGTTVWMQLPAQNDQRSISFFDGDGNSIDQNLNDKFIELDPTVSYDITFDKVTLSLGHIWYTDPGYGKSTALINGVKTNLAEIAPDSAEFYAGVAVDTIGQPQLTAYYDYRKLDYQYYSLGFSHTLEPKSLGEGFNLTPFVTFGFASNAADSKRIYNHNGLEHINLGVSTALKAGIFQVKPHLTYVFGLDRKRDDVERTTDQLVGGVDLSYDFSGI